MDFLKGEIERKRKQIQDSNVMSSEKKYFKRGDLAKKQQEEYWKNSKRMKAKTDPQDESTLNTVLQLNEASGSETKPSDKVPHRKEVIRRLRERNEPVRLFGESDSEAYQRLRTLEITMPEVNKGFKNDLKVAMDRVDEIYLSEVLKAGDVDEGSLSDKVEVKDASSYDDLQEMVKNVCKGDDNHDMDFCLKFFKHILKEWGDHLNQRPVEEKQSFIGKQESATHAQTIAYIKPLFRKLKKKTINYDIMDCLRDVIKYLLMRDYQQANRAYLEMSIGNAAWPIGVTMVGIHARPGREKVFSRNVAHVLNDETQRKYIQAVKRLMSKCQDYYPTDPAFSVNYGAQRNQLAAEIAATHQLQANQR